MTNEERIRATIQKVTEKDVPADAQESLFDSGVLDSFALLDMISELEKEFRFKVPEDDLNPRKFDSVARIAEYVTAHAS
jgi:acyl carrier protein